VRLRIRNESREPTADRRVIMPTTVWARVPDPRLHCPELSRPQRACARPSWSLTCGRNATAAPGPGEGRPASARRSRRSAAPGAAGFTAAYRQAPERPRARADQRGSTPTLGSLACGSIGMRIRIA
jgi:hypothetical protein